MKPATFHHERFSACLSATLERTTLARCAATTGISTATLSRINHGAVPSLETFLALCAWMQIKPVAFIGDAAPDCAECMELRRRLRAIAVLVEENAPPARGEGG